MEIRQRKKSPLSKLGLWFLAILQKSLLGKFFTSYDKANDRFQKKHKIHGKKNERKFAGFIEKNRIIGVVPKIVTFMMRIPLRDYGIMMFMSGIVVAVLYPINDMILFINVTFDMFVLGTATCVCALPLFFSSRSIASNVLSSRLFSYILFDFLGMDSDGFRQAADKEKISFATFSFLIGAGLGVASYFVLPTNTMLILLALVLAYSTIRTPEVGAVVTILLVPFVDITVVCICLAYTFVCYAAKVSLGKRIFNFEYFDLWVCIAIGSVSLFGFNYREPLGSLKSIAINLVIMVSYFLFSNLIHSKEWLRRSVVAFTTSSLLVAIVAVVQAVLGKVSLRWEIMGAVFPANGAVVSTLGDQSVLSHFMVAAIPFALVHMLSEKNDARKFGGFLLAVLLTAVLVIAKVPAAYFGLLIGVLLLFSFYKRGAIYLLIAVVIALPVLYFTLPDSVVELVFSKGPLAGVSLPSELAYIKETFMQAIKYPAGINLVGGNAQEIFGAEHTGSLLINLFADYGIISFLAVFILMITFARLMVSYSVKAKNEYRRVNCCAGLCSALALLSVGVFEHVFYDRRILVVFVLTIALSVAYVRIDREEEIVVPCYIDISFATTEIPLKEETVHVEPPRRSYVHAPRMQKQLKRQEKNKTAEAKEFSNTDELFIIKRKYDEEQNDEE